MAAISKLLTSTFAGYASSRILQAGISHCMLELPVAALQGLLFHSRSKLLCEVCTHRGLCCLCLYQQASVRGHVPYHKNRPMYARSGPAQIRVQKMLQLLPCARH